MLEEIDYFISEHISPATSSEFRGSKLINKTRKPVGALLITSQNSAGCLSRVRLLKAFLDGLQQRCLACGVHHRACLGLITKQNVAFCMALINETALLYGSEIKRDSFPYKCCLRHTGQEDLPKWVHRIKEMANPENLQDISEVLTPTQAVEGYANCFQ